MAVIAAAVLGLAGAWLAWGPPSSPLLLLLFALGVTVGEVRSIRLPSGETVSTGAVMGLAGVWLMEPAGAALVEVLGWILAGVYRRTLTLRVCFNAAQTALAALGAGAAFLAAGGTGGEPLSFQPLVAYVLAAAAFSLINSGLVGAAMALEGNEPMPAAILALYRSHLDRWILFTVISVVVAEAFLRFQWLAPAAYVVGIALVEHLLRWTRERELGRLEAELTEMLASAAVETRAAERLVRCAEAFGRYLDLPEQELRDLRFAALLSGAGLEEAQIRRGLGRAVALAGIHRILARRHEAWQAGGAQGSLPRRQIPRGARILAVIEAFDALTSAHRAGGSVGLRAALKALEERRGRNLDPELTTRFIDFVLEHEAEVQQWVDGPGGGPSEGLRQLARSLHEVLAQSGEPPGLAPAAGALVQSNLVDQGLALRLNMLLSETLTVCAVYRRIADILAHAAGEPCWVASYSGWGVFRLEAGRGTLATGPVTLSGDPGPMLRAVTRLGSAQASIDVQESPWSDLLPPGRWNVVAVPLVARGRVIGVLGAARPVPASFSATEPQLLEAVAGPTALALDNARLREDMRLHLAEVSSLKRFTDQVLDRMPVAVVAFGTDGRVRLLNLAARRLLVSLGLDAARMERLPLRAWVRLHRGFAALERAIKFEEEWRNPALALQVGDSVRIFDVHVTPVHGLNGTVIAAVGVAHDVTEHHRLERQVRESERMAAVGQLAAGAAHEIRNPLTAIKGFIQLMREDIPEEHENFDLVLAEIDRIERLVDDLLLMARPAPLQTAPCDINRLIKKVAALLRAQAHPQGVVIETDLARDLPEIQADGRQLRQVLFNLGRNAIEAMNDGGILRFETLLEHVDGQPVVTVRVRDTGAGIRAEDRPHIFEPFFTTKAGGTGLGLAVVYAIIRSHHGSIDVETGDGAGTVFTVRLPLRGGRGGVPEPLAQAPSTPDAAPEVLEP